MREPGDWRGYEPVADIAKGGMGRVELVVRREGSFARIYAMKRLYGELAKDPEVRAMFVEEARIAGLIRHPNVVPVLDVGEDDFGPYLVMDFVEGVAAYKPLLAAVESGERLSVAFCVEVARQAAHGLAAAHELVGAGGRKLSVIHRDISPQNILLGFDGLVRVTDFGVARILDHHPQDSAALTGKIGYMSPEQIGRRRLDGRSDLFSFGVVLYEMLACDRLYTGSREEVFRQICLEPVPDIRSVRDDVSVELAELVSELLAKTPEQRPASSTLVAERLDAIGDALRDEGREALLKATLLESFPEERKRQQDLVAAALERTRAEISLLEGQDSDGTDANIAATRAGVARPKTTKGGVESETLALPGSGSRSGSGKSDSESETRAITAPSSDEMNATIRERPTAARSASPMVPTSRWVVGAIAAGLAFMLVAAVIWVTTDDRPSADPEVASDECATSAICHESGGVASFCNLATHRCQSVVSEICPEYFPVEAGTDPSAIAIGTIFDRSTPNQLARAHAAELAALGVNQGGGIDGRRVLLIHCDASNGRAAAAADQLARAGVTAVVGPSTSSDVEAAFAAHADDEMLFISPSATATQLTAIDTGTPGLLWRTTPPDSLQSKVILSDLLAEPPATSLAVVRRANDVYAQSLSVILQESAREAGLVVDASEVFANAEAVPDVIDGAIESDPDAIVFLTSHIADAAAFLDAASAHRGYRGKLIYFADAAANDDLFALATRGAPLFGAIRATRPAAPSTIITTEFASDYMAANGGEDPLQFSFTAHTYDATLLVMLGAAYALRDGGELTGDRIAEGLALMSSGTEEHRLLAANIRATIAAIRSAHPNVDVVGASGDLDFDPITEELESGSYEILEVRGDPPRFVVARRVDVPE